MKITTVGIDLAKSVFQIHGVDERGKVVLRKQLKRSEVFGFFANLPRSLIGMEACEREIVLWHRHNEDSRRVERIAGIGPLTASAYVASVGNAKASRMGGKSPLGWGSYRDKIPPAAIPSYWASANMATCICARCSHGARAVLRHLEHRPDRPTAGSSA